MSYRLLLRLSSWVYRRLKAGGISVPKAPYQRARLHRASKGKWGELKTALLTEAQAAKRSKDATLFVHKLIERIEEVERERPSHPLVDAVFSSGPTLRAKIESDLTVSTDQLNKSQIEALTKAHENKVLFILGAAGTGKTRVLSRIVGDFVTAGETTLLCCHTKAAVDHATDRLEPSVREDSCFKAKTFASVVMDQDTTSVQNVVIDEASMASLPHILFLTSLASKRVIFCGDPMQLPPIAGSGELSEKWLKRDIFAHQSGTEDIRELYAWNDKNRDISVLLREQFDIPRQIFSIANYLYYGNRLNCQSRTKGIISFIDTSKQNPPLTGTRSSPINEAHAEIVANQVGEALEKRTLTADTIGILTPFRAQQKYLKERTNNNGKKCNVSFNILPNKDVKETINVEKYILSKRKIEAVFNRNYTNKMIKSPNHLIFLTSLVHLQKMIYIYLSYEFGFSLSLNKKEHMKIWPTKINIELPKLITKTENINQVIQIKSLRKTGEKSYFGTCISSIEGKNLITADAVIYLL